ncbi:putative Glycosyl hydrolase, BNR repeat-containing protein [Syntrophobacter sp. SbD2]|nr:putative Glycosyl hydrolase, BNR repeat-containing protein [Syntrophobacter sp. SbD2]
MKSNHLLIVALLCAGLLLFLTFPAAHSIGQEPYASYCAQKAIGWAVGDPVDGYGTILHTTDGGQKWERQGTSIDIPNVSLTGISAVNADEAWAVGEPDPESGYAVILHTKDGGWRWTREGLTDDLRDVSLQAVSAVNENIAWAVGFTADEGVILRTRNGGDLWERQGIGQVPNVKLNGVYASDPFHVWVVGVEEVGNSYGTILRTTDGGATWGKVSYTLSPTISTPYLLTVDGANANQVWAVGRGQIVHISVTRRGISVTVQKTFGYIDVNGVYALNDRTIWAVTDYSGIWRSDDGGTTWNQQPAPPPPPVELYVLRVCAIDERHAWETAGGYPLTGAIWNTSDGGTTWAAQIISVAPSSMWGISFVRKQD